MAPRAPIGASRRAAKVKEAQKMMRIRVLDQTLVVSPNNIPFATKARIRKGTGGLSLGSYFAGETALDEDSIQVLWWAARMVNGEPMLSIDDVLEQWPDDLTNEDVEISIVDEAQELAEGTIEGEVIEDPQS